MDSKRDSVIAVFDAVASCGELSRAGISDMTGFSQVTVGKAVEILDGMGVLVQHKQSTGTAGRKAGLCRLEAGRGLLLFDLTGDKVCVRICDIGLDIKKEYIASADVCEAFMSGFSDFVEIFGDGLAGIGCVVPGGKTENYREMLTGTVPFVPDLIIEADRAFGCANAFRFDVSGCWFSLRISADGRVGGTLMYGSRPYTGAHALGGDLGRVIDGDDYIKRLIALCDLLDPALVHIACDDENTVSTVNADLTAAFAGMCDDNAPAAAVEAVCSCRDAPEGAARVLRENYIVSKLANYS